MDVSEGGISVLCTVNLPVRTECTVHVPLPLPPNGRKLLQMRAVVQYGILSSSGGGFQLGMTTVQMEEAAREAIRLLHQELMDSRTGRRWGWPCPTARRCT